MRNPFLAKSLTILALLICFCAPCFADSSADEAVKSLPDKLNDFRAVGAVKAGTPQYDYPSGADAYEVAATVFRNYRVAQGGDFKVWLVKTRADRGAYSLFSSVAQNLPAEVTKLDNAGTLAVISSSGRILIYKGTTFIDISDVSVKKDNERLISFAKLLAEPVDKGEGEIPVLVKHLPEWEAATQRAVYSVSLPVLQNAAGGRPVLDAVSFEGGAEAVTAPYGSSRLVIIEHSTPQLATDNDARINTRINELKASGQPTPSAYRRVGNYAVFVFDAPDEAAATQLIDKIAYEQVVQWLGNNPHWFERAERNYRETTAGVIVAVFKTAGLSLIICLAIGAFFGGIIFRRRRAQAAMSEAYSDAGGMLRLNIDEMTPRQVDASRLLGKGDS